jgi:hypothetical protein
MCSFMSVPEAFTHGAFLRPEKLAQMDTHARASSFKVVLIEFDDRIHLYRLYADTTVDHKVGETLAVERITLAFTDRA